MTVDKNQGSKFKVLLSIFMISISLFIYQIVLTRLYSAVFSYHFVFLITSLAILGLGIGSVLVYRLKNGLGKAGDISMNLELSEVQTDINGQIAMGSGVLAFSYLAVFIINYLLPFVSGLLVYVILGTIPFIIGGYLLAISFAELSEISGKLYFADLVGSGIGSLAAIFLLNNAGMLRTVIFLFIAALIPAIILPSASIKIKSSRYVLLLIVMAVFLLPGQYIDNIEKNFSGILNNNIKTFGSLKNTGLSPEIVFSKWNAFSRTDVIKLPKEPDEMILTIDGSANAPMFRFNGDIKSLEGFKKDIGFIPFSDAKDNKTLLIGSGGGRDVLYALAGGSKDITAVEINTSSIAAVKAFNEYNGNIYNRPEIKVFAEDGRSFVKKSNDKYDLIFMSLVMTNTTQGVGYALSENYIYTVEAMKDYFDHLQDNGKIAFLAHDEKDLSKIIATAVQALNNKGIAIKDTPNYITVFAKSMTQEHSGTSMHYPIVIIKNQPFSAEESKSLSAAADIGGNNSIYLPAINEQGVLAEIKEEKITMQDYLKGFSSNVAPATDNSPYFYNFSKGVPLTLILILLAAGIAFIALFSSFVGKLNNIKPTIYFSLLGLGFMMIEIPLIQKFILYLGHPSLAFTYVLAALLIGSGLGGYLCNSSLFNRNLKNIYIPPVMVAIINITLLLSLGNIFQNTFEFNLTSKIIVASFIALLQGFFMGMPFPKGLKLIAESGRGDIIPVMWGVNGVTSVIGSVLSVILSMTIGFTGALIAGALIYLLISILKPN